MKMRMDGKTSGKFLLVLFIFFTAFSLQAQNRIVTGTVTDEVDDSPLPGVSVLVLGTSRGTVTGIDGNYSVNLPEDKNRLVFSMLGYVNDTITVGDRTLIDVSLSENIQALQEVVVIGYGAVKKSDLTGSVSSIKQEDITAYPSSGTIQTLQGRAAGVQIQSNNGGEPGAPLKVRIRGGTSINADSDPIYVVDGFVGATIPPPQDIQSIEVLKDASATAIYGSRGANGVVIITTKKGKPGTVRVDVNSSYSIQSPSNQLDLLDADEFASYIQEINPNYQQGPANTNWQDELFRTGWLFDNQLSISGGSEDVRYYISGTYFDQAGVARGSGFERYSLNSKVDFDISEKLNLSINVFGRRNSRDGLRTQETTGGAGSAGATSAAFRFNPDLGVFDEDGNYTITTVGDDIDNPVAIADEILFEDNNDRFQSNLQLNYQIIDHLSFTSTFGATVRNGRQGAFYPTTVIRGQGVDGLAEQETDRNNNYLTENYFSYNREFNGSSFNAVLGYSYQRNQYTAVDAAGSGFVDNSVQFWNLEGASEYLRPDSDFSEWQLASFYSRLNYSYQSKYIATFTARYDGSSTFSRNNKWAFFPSGALAWDMKGEPFMDNLNVVTQWKWRVSYGLTGNRAIDPYGTLAKFEPIYSVQGNELVNAVAIEDLSNDELRWETTGQINIGADIGFFSGRLNLSVDAYRMETRDLLFEVPLFEIIGVGDPEQVQNVGRMENRGIELALNSRNTVGAFKWSTDFNISANRNKILELPNGQDLIYSSSPGHLGISQTQVLRVGQPVGVFYGFIYDGVYQVGEETIPGPGFEQDPGGAKFRDIDSFNDLNEKTGEPDGQLTNADQTIIGNPQPDFIWGLNNSFSYKGFDLNMFFQSSVGNDILSYTLLELDVLRGANNATTAALNRWSRTNPNTDVPRAAQRPPRMSDRFIFDGTYVRLKNLSLGYTFSSNRLQEIGINRLKIYASGQNLLTFTNFPGLDPEVNFDSNSTDDSNLNLGLDYGSYPNVQTYTFGINLGI